MRTDAETSVYQFPGGVAPTLVRDSPVRKSSDDAGATFLQGLRRRIARERRRRKVGRAYDMAVEIAKMIPYGSKVLDVGCGNGFIAHHLSALLSEEVVGIDVMKTAEAAIHYRLYDGRQFPVRDKSFDAVLLCYVLHHSQDIHEMLDQVRRVLRSDGLAIIYEDIPWAWWDKGVCWIHNLKWKHRTGPCVFRDEAEWRKIFEDYDFELIGDRQLSRARNIAHPVRRTLFHLRKQKRKSSELNDISLPGIVNRKSLC